MEAMDWSKKKVLVTGASSGLGLELARLLSKNGARLVLTYCSEKHLDAAKAVLGQGDYAFLYLDQGKRESVISFLASVSSFDCVFLNAGVYFPSGSSMAFPDATFRVNAVGTYLLLKGLIAKGTSSFILTSSMNRAWPLKGIEALCGKMVSPRASYAYSKEALSAFPCLFPEIDVKVVEPGLLKTNIYGKTAPFFWKLANRLLLPMGTKAEDAAGQMLTIRDRKGVSFVPKGLFRLRGQLVPFIYDRAQKEKEGRSFLRLLGKAGLI